MSQFEWSRGEWRWFWIGWLLGAAVRPHCRFEDGRPVVGMSPGLPSLWSARARSTSSGIGLIPLMLRVELNRVVLFSECQGAVIVRYRNMPNKNGSFVNKKAESKVFVCVWWSRKRKSSSGETNVLQTRHANVQGCINTCGVGITTTLQCDYINISSRFMLRLY